MTALHSPSGTGDAESTLLMRENTDDEKVAARSALLRMMQHGDLSAEDVAGFLPMLGLADDLMLPDAPLWLKKLEDEKAARPRATPKKSEYCRSGLHPRTPENVGHGGRCTPCRREAAGARKAGSTA